MTDLEREVTDLEYLRNVVASYQEIAALRMRRVKKSVLQNRIYMTGLEEVYKNLKQSYKKEFARLSKKRKQKGALEVRKTNGRTVCVYLSANTGLYGSIVVDTFYDFLEQVRAQDFDVAIVGRIGKGLYDAVGLKNKMHYFDMSDSAEDIENKTALWQFLVQYEKIIVFHGQFKNILVQKPERAFISGDTFLELDTADDAQELKKAEKFIFEPDLQQTLLFFEKRILSSVFEHSLHESSLSKYASRMISLDTATDQIDKRASTLHIKSQKTKHKILNNKQMTTLVSMHGRIQHG